MVRACGGRSTHPALDQLSFEATSIGDLPPEPGTLFVALREGGQDDHVLVEPSLRAGSGLALVAEDWPGLKTLAPPLRRRAVVVDDTLGAYRSLAAFMRSRFAFPVVAVGGSCGKTTTKDLLAALLSSGPRRVSKTPQTMNGFSGLPYTLCQRQHNRAEPPDVLVVEIGIDRLGAMQEHLALVAPDMALLSALGPEHLAGLGSERQAADEELQLLAPGKGRRRVWQAAEAGIAERLDTACAGDVLVWGRGQLDISHWQERGLDLLSFRALAQGTAASEVELCWVASGGGGFTQRFVVPAPGLHNIANFALAAGAACGLGCGPDELREGLARYRPPAARLQPYALANGATLVDDSYNASPASVAAALQLLGAPAWRHRPKTLILGDMLDLGADSERYHRCLAEPLVALEPEQLLLVGEGTRALAEELVAEDSVAEATTFRGELRHLTMSSAEDLGGLLEHVRSRALSGRVLLVKGSRGMGLERVVQRLEQLSGQQLPLQERQVRCTVVGMRHHRLTAELVAAALGVSGSHAEIETLSLEALRAGRVASAPVVLFSDFEPDGCAPDGPELALARLAQPILQLEPGGCAILNAGDEVAELLAEIVPKGVRLVRFGGGAAAGLHGGEHGDLLELAVASGGEDAKTAALAALAVANCLGEPRALAVRAVAGGLLDAAIAHFAQASRSCAEY